MLKKKIIGIVLIVIGLFCAFGAFSVNSSAPETAEVIGNAVYVSDGKVLPENEGKVVIVPGMLDAAPFVDPETGIVIHDIVAYRKVEKLTIAEETNNDKTYEVWSWSESYDKNEYGGTEKLVAPNVSLGEFKVASELVQSITLYGQRSEYDKKELNQRGWNVFTDNGKVYLSTEDYLPDEDDSVTRLTKDYRHSLRVSYVEMSGGPEYTVVALQKDGQLVRVPDVTLQALQSGHLTQAEVLENAESSAKGGMIIAIVGAVLCLGAGAFLIIKKEKQAA